MPPGWPPLTTRKQYFLVSISVFLCQHCHIYTSWDSAQQHFLGNVSIILNRRLKQYSWGSKQYNTYNIFASLPENHKRFVTSGKVFRNSLTERDGSSCIYVICICVGFPVPVVPLFTYRHHPHVSLFAGLFTPHYTSVPLFTNPSCDHRICFQGL